MKTKLFIIKQKDRELYWNHSAEHGTGWNPNTPKQSFSPSELTKEIRMMIDNNWFTNCEILEMWLEENNG